MCCKITICPEACLLGVEGSIVGIISECHFLPRSSLCVCQNYFPHPWLLVDVTVVVHILPVNVKEGLPHVMIVPTLAIMTMYEGHCLDSKVRLIARILNHCLETSVCQSKLRAGLLVE